MAAPTSTAGTNREAMTTRRLTLPLRSLGLLTATLAARCAVTVIVGRSGCLRLLLIRLWQGTTTTCVDCGQLALVRPRSQPGARCRGSAVRHARTPGLTLGVAGCSSHIERFSCPRSAPPSGQSVAGPSRGVPAHAGTVDGCTRIAVVLPGECPRGLGDRPCASGVLPVCSSRVFFSSSHSAPCASPSLSAFARSSSHRSARARMTRAAVPSPSG